MYANKKKAHFSYQEACLLWLFYSKLGVSYLLLMAYSHSGGGRPAESPKWHSAYHQSVFYSVNIHIKNCGRKVTTFLNMFIKKLKKKSPRFPEATFSRFYSCENRTIVSCSLLPDEASAHRWLSATLHV